MTAAVRFLARSSCRAFSRVAKNSVMNLFSSFSNSGNLLWSRGSFFASSRAFLPQSPLESDSGMTLTPMGTGINTVCRVGPSDTKVALRYWGYIRSGTNMVLARVYFMQTCRNPAFSCSGSRRRASFIRSAGAIFPFSVKVMRRNSDASKRRLAPLRKDFLFRELIMRIPGRR